MTACSSVGRAGDCSTCKISLGHWFDSGRADSFANDTTNAFAIFSYWLGLRVSQIYPTMSLCVLRIISATVLVTVFGFASTQSLEQFLRSIKSENPTRKSVSCLRMWSGSPSQVGAKPIRARRRLAGLQSLQQQPSVHHYHYVKELVEN